MSEYVVDLTEKMATDLRFFRRERIVRCEDCAYFDTRKCKSQWSFRLDGFCAWGEPRADA